ncbi:MAG: hypothetical protein BMS9Abin23_0072 [Thermodesulfobacteriota bacterium]|nr:MAG: hypothetical protein BMS9Abin23_0072 [Thermodesulfobacteriota bacterium]
MVELLTVIFIIAILTAIASPSFFSWVESAKYKDAALGVASDLRFGRQTAVTDNRETRVEFNLGGKRYRLTEGNLASSSTSWSTVKSWDYIEAEVNWVTGTTCNGSADMNITFRPNGSSGGGTICINDTVGANRYKVVVSTISGRVDVQ